MLIGAEETFAWRGVLVDLNDLRDRGFVGIDEELLSTVVHFAQHRLASYKEGLVPTAAIEQAFSLEDTPQSDTDNTLLAILQNAVRENNMTEDYPRDNDLMTQACALSWPDTMVALNDYIDLQVDPTSSSALNVNVVRDMALIMFYHTPSVTRTIFQEAERYIITTLNSADVDIDQRRKVYFKLLHNLSQGTIYREGDDDFPGEISTYFGFLSDSSR